MLSIYPNPSNGEFVVESAYDLELTVSNELGQVIRKVEISAANNRKLNFTDLSPGIYFISGKHEQQPFNQKVIIRQ